MNKKTLAVVLLVACLAGIIVAWAASPYIWLSDEITVTDDITITGALSTTTLVVGETLTVTVSMTNPTGADVLGTLLVEIWTSDGITLTDTLFSDTMTLLTAGFTDDYDWVAVAGSYKAKATFTTS